MPRIVFFVKYHVDSDKNHEYSNYEYSWSDLHKPDDGAKLKS